MLKNSRSGQSVVEFSFVVIIFLNLVFLTFNAVLAFAVHQYVSYAAFMSARAFQSAGANPEDQTRRARHVLQEYLFLNGQDSGELKFPGFGRVLAYIDSIYIPDAANVPYDYRSIQPTNERAIRVNFRSQLFHFPLGQASINLAWVPLRAESFLGREATAEECGAFFRAFLGSDTIRGGRQNINLWRGMDDNNC